MIPRETLELARARLSGLVLKTPCIEDKNLSALFKLENLQRTGSFKIRGALNKVLTLDHSECSKALVAASAGNHGQGVALAANILITRSTIFASNHAVPKKIDAMQELGAEVHLVYGGYEVAEQSAKEFALRSDGIWISPYNDVQVIAGQATVGLEILDQLKMKKPDVIIVPLGGGGLLSGIGAALDYSKTDIRLIGVQSSASPFFHALFNSKCQSDVIEKPSLAYGLSGALEESSVTIPLVKQFIEDVVLVTETEIRKAIAYAWYYLGQRVEGSGAVSLAAIMSGRVTGNSPCCVITGGNIQEEVLLDILNEYPKELIAI